MEESFSFKNESGKKTILFRGESVIYPNMFHIALDIIPSYFGTRISRLYSLMFGL